MILENSRWDIIASRRSAGRQFVYVQSLIDDIIVKENNLEVTITEAEGRIGYQEIW